MDEQDQPATQSEDGQARKLRRRNFLKISGGVAVAGLTAGVAWLGTGPGGGPMTLDESFAALDRLEGLTLTSTGEWTPYRIFSHAAQSVEMSMTGYPDHRSALFKNTLGSTVFSVFRKRGRMRHSLSEPIPGAPIIQSDGDVELAVRRLRQALQEFDGYEGDLEPHFAYGLLSKAQYAAAHVMHLNNHLSEIVAT